MMPLMVFFLFALCLLAVLLTGSGVYRNTVTQGQSLSASRTAVRYLTTRVRQADRRGCLSLEHFSGTDALVIREEIEGEVYKTMVYCHEGYLRELFCGENGVFSPDDGEKILPMEQLTLEKNGELLRAQVLLPDENAHELILYLRSSGEGLP